MIYFELIFSKCEVYGFWEHVNGCPLVPGPFVGKTILFALNFFCIFVKNPSAILI